MQSITPLGYQEDTTYDSPSIYGGGRGGQKYLDIQDQTMEKLAHMTPDKTSLNKVSLKSSLISMT